MTLLCLCFPLLSWFFKLVIPLLLKLLYVFSYIGLSYVFFCLSVVFSWKHGLFHDTPVSHLKLVSAPSWHFFLLNEALNLLSFLVWQTVQVEMVLIRMDRYLLWCCGLETKLSIDGTSYLYPGRLPWQEIEYCGWKQSCYCPFFPFSAVLFIH